VKINEFQFPSPLEPPSGLSLPVRMYFTRIH